MKKTCMLEKIKQTFLLRKEPSWLIDLRLQALARLLESDFFQKEGMDFFDKVSDPPVLKEMDPSPRLMQLGSRNLYEQLPMELINQGVIFTNFLDSIKRHEKLVKDYWQAKIELFESNQKLAELVAFVNSGAFLYVPKNVEITLPMEYFWVKSENSEIPIYVSILILVEEGGRVNYVERLQSVEKSGNLPIFLHFFSEVIAKKGAKVNFWANETLNQQVKAYIWRFGKLHQNAQVNWQINALNNGDTDLKVKVDLVEEGACTTVKIAGISSGQQEQKIKTQVRNCARHSAGKIVQHGVVQDQGKLLFEGVGKIQKEAKGAISKQEIRVLMLSDKAQAKVNPILLIDEDEVTAEHAASIAHTDEEAMYYLMSRGIKRKQAVHLLIRGFLDLGRPSFFKSEWAEVLEGKLNV
ncbi:MAG: SufD family Fe-S cluster assembly protein [Lactobacillales bacterium]|jgi:Fe-S cluster assembly protein SufD|nr:SufD family Fe-S cluster assembly protein [Lactobacillales bacterium]